MFIGSWQNFDGSSRNTIASYTGSVIQAIASIQLVLTDLDPIKSNRKLASPVSNKLHIL